jgi:hypothetical protein
VILGNPPYNRFTGVAEDEQADLIEPYKTGLFEKWGVRKQLLDDLYIRFFRLAEKRIAEIGGRGVISFISNYSWLQGLSHPVMRKPCDQFDGIWIDNCNGDKYRTGSGRLTGDQMNPCSQPTSIDWDSGWNSRGNIRRKDTHPSDELSPQSPSSRSLGTGNENAHSFSKSLVQRARGVPRYETVVPRAIMRCFCQ